MHGRKRNAEEYRDQWIETSNELNLLVVVPEFSNKNFPEVWGFNYGNVKTKNLEPIQINGVYTDTVPALILFIAMFCIDLTLNTHLP